MPYFFRYSATKRRLAGVSSAALYMSGVTMPSASSPKLGRIDSSTMTAPPITGSRPFKPASW